MSHDKKSDAYFECTQSELADRISRAEFFHDMALNDGVRTGTWVYDTHQPPNYHLWPVFNYLSQLNLSDAICMDVGTYDGMTAFVMSQYGASEVHATCQFDLDRFRMVRAYQEFQNIFYYPKTDLNWLSKNFDSGQLDLLVISAMLHHLTSPLDAFLEARRMLKREGLFIVESIITEGDGAALYLNSELNKPIYGAPTLFVPTADAVRGLLRFASFDIISETRLLGGRSARETHFDRVTFLARAKRPSELSAASEKTQEIHDRSPLVGNIDFSSLNCDTSEPSEMAFDGDANQHINIWMDRPKYPFQPVDQIANSVFDTGFGVGTEKYFMELVKNAPQHAFQWEDVYLLGAKYQGETMPEGMQWSIKQFGNLHALHYVTKYGLAKILEVGPGFNFYFPNHLPDWCDYTGLDDAGFYDEHVLSLANSNRMRGQVISGLLGDGGRQLAPDSFDACISISVLEHIEKAQIATVCDDMYRVIRPGGFALHSLDLPQSLATESGRDWLNALRDAGFEIDNASVDATWSGCQTSPTSDEIFYEPLSIRSRFNSGYRKTIWDGDDRSRNFVANMITILIAARKPI